MKEMYQVTQKGKRGGIPIDWYKLPEGVIEKVDPEFIYNMYALGDDGIYQKSVIYLRKVSKFRKGLTEFEYSDNIILGV